ncbi:hypothetical protein [Streptomyces pratensis]|uniref:hypothetical protein n=1 Tax=Streptomyces pratensis TaxID=1169025 RepID=UPI003018C835
MDERPRGPRGTKARRVVTALAVGAVVAAAAAGGWFVLGPGADRGAAGCAGLGGDPRVRTALGDAYRPGMGCGELGRAMREAAAPDANAGAAAGGHSQKAAAAMKNILLAADDAVRSSERLDLDQALRLPLARAMAHYEDVSVLLTDPADSVYARESLFSRGPWKAEDGYHMAVDDDSLIRVIRAVSADPEAYAILRDAQTAWEARRLASLSPDSEELRWSVGARAFGKLDGVAAHVHDGLSPQDAGDWDAAVSRHLVARAEERKGGEDSVAERIEQAWQRTLARAPEAQHVAVVERQCAVMLDAAGLSAAENTCLNLASHTASRALRVLRAV